MIRRVAFLAVPVVIALSLEGCALNLFEFERREAWRADEEQACMAARPFRRDDYITQARAINDHGVCGMERPLQVAALTDGSVTVGPTATIGCPMTLALEQWLAASVQPAAAARLGASVIAIDQMSDYACRTRNNQAGAELSEHAFGNALDIGGFRLSDGRVVTVEDGWSGGSQAERDFLREVHASACQYFKTVLGPGVAYHGDHFHLDLAHHNEAGTSVYCRPDAVVPPSRAPVFNLPVAETPPSPILGFDRTPQATVFDPAEGGIADLIQSLGQ